MVEQEALVIDWMFGDGGLYTPFAPTLERPCLTNPPEETPLVPPVAVIKTGTPVLSLIKLAEKPKELVAEPYSDFNIKGLIEAVALVRPQSLVPRGEVAAVKVSDITMSLPYLQPSATFIPEIAAFRAFCTSNCSFND